VATLLVALGAALFLPLKYAIPGEIAFWADRPLAAAERAIFSVDPWRVLDRLFGWATLPLDRVYGLWLPLQSLALFTLILSRSSRAKAHALIAYVLAWFFLGVLAAVIFSSAGPLFYDRIFGGSSFSGLRETLQARGAWMALAESDRMWASLESGQPGFVAGISAVPSLHVAISVWIFLTVRTIAPKLAPLAFAYVVAIGIGSVQLGWHYIGDGVAGAVGMLVIWRLVGTCISAQDRPAFRHVTGQRPI
jgi:hypothetical protein